MPTPTPLQQYRNRQTLDFLRRFEQSRRQEAIRAYVETFRTRARENDFPPGNPDE